MAGQLPGNPSQHGIVRDGADMISQNILDLEGPQFCTPKWYFSRQEIEDHSPSRKDGIDLKKETQLQKLYCSFIQELGMKLKVPQITIATAMILCHRFYMRQSHAKNEWQTIATVCMFLASKLEETPRLLKDVVVVAYGIMYKRDPAAAQRIKQKEVYEKQKELLLIGERVLLTTIAFDFNIQHPYKPLVSALKRLKISHNELAKVAWNFVNDWLCTTLCLQYKPHYIAAGSMFLAAKFHKVKLPSEKGKVWWMEFDVSPKQLEEVTQQMLGLLEQNRKPGVPCVHEKAIQAAVVEKAVSCSPQSCVISGSITAGASSHVFDGEADGSGQYTNSKDTNLFVARKELSQCRMSDCGSMNSVVEDGNASDDGEVQARTVESNLVSSCKIVSIHGGLSDIDKGRIREALKRRCDRATNKVVVAVGDDEDDDAWIERELESGIELESTSAVKRQRLI